MNPYCYIETIFNRLNLCLSQKSWSDQTISILKVYSNSDHKVGAFASYTSHVGFPFFKKVKFRHVESAKVPNSCKSTTLSQGNYCGWLLCTSANYSYYGQPKTKTVQGITYVWCTERIFGSPQFWYNKIFNPHLDASKFVLNYDKWLCLRKLNLEIHSIDISA